MNDYSHFTEVANRWEQTTKATWGSHDICPLLSQFYVMAISHLLLSAISRAKAWRDPKKPKLGMAYLIAPAQTVEEERIFRLVAMWVHPCQTLLSLLEEAAKKLTLLVNTGDDWPCAFVQFCEDSQHIPLSDAGHISIMVDGAPSRITSSHLSCLEICKLLQCGREVVYPECLNGGFKPIWVPLPKQSVWDTESTNKLAILQINLPSTTHGDATMAASQWSSKPISSPHSVTECLSDTVTRLSMGEEVEKLLSGALSNTPEQSLVLISPRKPPPMTPNIPAASKEKAPSDLGEIIAVYPKQLPPSPHESLQVGTANAMVHSSCSPSPTLGTPEMNSTPNPSESQPNSITLPYDVLHFQKEMNNAMVHLLTFRASVDAHQQRLISESEIAHCQNETKAMKPSMG